MNPPDLPHSVKRISPMLAVANMIESVDFYVTVLGFHAVMEFPDYSIVERDGATIHLMKAADASVMEAVRGHTEIYIEVDDIKTLWAYVKTFKDRYKIRDLFDRPYGMTEFHIGAPDDGCLIFVGQRTEEIPKLPRG